MLSEADVKEWLQDGSIKNLYKILIVLAFLGGSRQVREIVDCAEALGFRKMRRWNVSQSLSGSIGVAISTPNGWEITRKGLERLKSLGIDEARPEAVRVADDLRRALAEIKNEQTRSFVEEAIKCYEADLHRSAVIMSWVGAVSILHEFIFDNHLEAFNKEAKRVGRQKRDATGKSDLGKMTESDFLDIMATLSLLDRDVKKMLKECLDRRNVCSHPNDARIGANVAASHIETLILNVFTKFP